jgi:plasmid replication initiation protein
VTGEIQVKFSEDIVKYLDGNEYGYCELLLSDVAELKSFYAFRWLEMARSYESLAGQKGNKKNEWWFGRSVEEIRELFGIEKDEYKDFAELRRRVIEGPIAEINKSKIGIELTPEYIQDKYDKRVKKGVKIHCRRKQTREKRKVTVTFQAGSIRAEIKIKNPAPMEMDICNQELAKLERRGGSLPELITQSTIERQEEKRRQEAEKADKIHKEEVQTWKEKHTEEWENIFPVLLEKFTTGKYEFLRIDKSSLGIFKAEMETIKKLKNTGLSI